MRQSEVVKSIVKYLTIDPGIQGTGWAVWDYKWRLQSCGVLSASPKLSWEEKMKSIAYELFFKGSNCDHVYIEYPQKFSGAGGDMVASKGDLGKLFTCVGYLIGYLTLPFTLVPVIKWKGQLPKKVVNDRIRRILHSSETWKLSPNFSHDWDAVGIGLYIQERF